MRTVVISRLGIENNTSNSSDFLAHTLSSLRFSGHLLWLTLPLVACMADRGYIRR